MPPSAQGIRAGQAFVEITARDQALIKSLARASAKLKAFEMSVRDLGTQLIRATAVAALPFAAATRTFANFSDQMAKVRAVTGASEQDFNRLNELAKELGRTTSFTASEVAAAMVELGRAVFAPDAILASTAAVLDLARATDTELARAAEIAGGVLRGFNLDVSESARVADVLVSAANNSSQGLDDIGEAMKFVAPLAKEAGASLEDTAAAIGILANNNLKGTVAGTALARAYKNLSTELAQRKLREFGIEAVDSSGNIRDLSTILAELGESTRELGSAKRLSIFEDLFGRASAAALKLASPDAQIEDLQQKLLDAQGTARRTAETMDDTLGGGFRRLMSAVEGVAIAVGESLDKTFRSWADTLSNISAWITKVIEKNRDLVVTIAKVVAIAGAAGAALVVVGTVLAGLGTVLGGLASLASIVGTAIGLIGTALGALLSPIGLITAALVGLGAVFLTSTQTGAEALSFLKEQFESLRTFAVRSFEGIAAALQAGELALAAEILWLSLKQLWQEGIAFLEEKWLAFRFSFQRIFNEAVTGVAILINDVFTDIQIAWAESAAFMSKTWASFTSAFLSGLATIRSNFVKGMAVIRNKLGELSDEEAKAIVTTQDNQLKKRLEQLGGEAQAQAQQADQQRDTRRSELETQRQQINVGLAEDLDREIEALAAKRNAQLAETQAEIDRTKRELESALSKAKSLSVDTGDEATTGGDGPRTIPRSEQIAKGLPNIDDLERIVKGTFSPAAIRSLNLGGTSAAERTAQATEDVAASSQQIARNTRDTAKRLKDGEGLTFA